MEQPRDKIVGIIFFQSQTVADIYCSVQKKVTQEPSKLRMHLVSLHVCQKQIMEFVIGSLKTRGLDWKWFIFYLFIYLFIYLCICLLFFTYVSYIFLWVIPLMFLDKFIGMCAYTLLKNI